MFLLWAHFDSNVFCTWYGMKEQFKEKHFLLKLVRIITYHQWAIQNCFLSNDVIMHISYTCINAHTQVSVRGEEKDLGCFLKRLSTKQHQATATFQPHGLNAINLLSNRLLCSNACPWVLYIPLHGEHNSLPVQT